MGKVVKIIGMVVILAAVTIATAGTGTAILGGATLGGALNFGAGLTAAITGTSVGTLIAAGSIVSAIGGAIGSERNLEETGANARGQPQLDPNAYGAFVFGKTAFPQALLFEEAHGTNELYSVRALAWHEIEGFDDFWVEGEAVTFSGGTSGTGTGSIAGILDRTVRTGAIGGQSYMPGGGGTWSSTAKGDGMAMDALAWDFESQTKYSQVPTDILVEGRGAKLYDPRLDPTYGSGSQDYATPSTFTYNDGNAALVALRYIIGQKSDSGAEIWGRHDPETSVNMDSFITAANVADEIRDGVPRYRLGGFMLTTNDHADFFDRWEATTGGVITRIDGVWHCWLPNDDLTAVGTITDADLLVEGGAAMRVGTAPENIKNTCRGRFISASNLYQGMLYPQVTEATAVTDDGGARILDKDFEWLQDIETAERQARYAIRRTRYPRRWTVTLGWPAFTVAPLSVWNLNLSVETDGVNELVRVIDRQRSANGVCVLTLQEENVALYDDTIPLGTAPTVSAAATTNQGLKYYNPTYSDNTPIDDLRPAAINADVTGNNTAQDTSNVNSVSAATVQTNAQIADDLTSNNGVQLHRSSIDDLLFTANEDFVMTEGANTRRVINSLIPFTARDGDSKTYSPTFGALPRVFYPSSGATFDPTLNTTTKQHYIVRTSTSATVSGHTALLRLKERDLGTITARSISVSGTGLSRDTANKGINDSGTTATVDDKYTMHYQITLTGFTNAGEDFPGTARVEFWENSSGAFVLRGSKVHSGPQNTTPTNVADNFFITRDGIDSADNFRIVVVLTSGGTSSVSLSGTVPSFKYSTSDVTGTSDVSATPTGVDDASGFLLHSEDVGQVT